MAGRYQEVHSVGKQPHQSLAVLPEVCLGMTLSAWGRRAAAQVGLGLDSALVVKRSACKRACAAGNMENDITLRDPHRLCSSSKGQGKKNRSSSRIGICEVGCYVSSRMDDPPYGPPCRAASVLHLCSSTTSTKAMRLKKPGRTTRVSSHASVVRNSPLPSRPVHLSGGPPPPRRQLRCPSPAGAFGRRRESGLLSDYDGPGTC